MEELSRRIHSHYVIHGWMVAAAGTRRRPKPRSRICPSASALSPRAACSCQSHSQEEGKHPQWNDRIGLLQAVTGKIVRKEAS